MESRYALGLDIGSNSVGSAWFDRQTGEIVAGVSVFPAGVGESDDERGERKRTAAPLRWRPVAPRGVACESFFLLREDSSGRDQLHCPQSRPEPLGRSTSRMGGHQ
jgi:hypothetical protein